MDKIFTVNNILDILLRRLWLIVILVCLGGGVAFTYSEYIIPKKYTASVTMYVYNQSQQQQQQTVSDIALSEKLVDTYMVILKSNHVLDKVSDRINEQSVNYTATALYKMITVETVEETEVFRVSVSSYSKEHSKIIADAISQIAPDEIIRVVKAGAVEIVDAAELPTTYSSPNISRNTIIGIVLGFVFACAFSLILELMNTSVKSRDDLMDMHKYPVLAVIPNLDGRAKNTKNHYGYSYGNVPTKSMKEADNNGKK